MGKRYSELQPDQTAFIAEQHMFFVATAPERGRVNLSPKGMDALRVVSPTRILWLNLTGSGNETAAHLAHDPRITLMWCGFEERPLILRAYGTARAVHTNHSDWPALAAHLPAQPGARQIMDVAIDLVQSSCGFAVPFMDFAGDRPVLRDWALDKGEDGLRDYWQTRNTETIDGAPTGIAR
jgi:Pyridoxamine 5'-phosphate oxidase